MNIVSCTARPARLGRVGCAALLAVAGQLTTISSSRADDEPIMHHVTYTVTAAAPIYADIDYLDQEPPVFSDYSHNPYRFVPNIHVDISPRTPWTYDLMLANPFQWAFFTASTGPEPGTPMFHCRLAVDGAVVASSGGARGVLCSLRPW